MCNHITHLVCIQPFSRRGWIPAGKPWTYPRSKKKTNNTCLFFVGWSPYGKPLNLNPWGFVRFGYLFLWGDPHVDHVAFRPWTWIVWVTLKHNFKPWTSAWWNQLDGTWGSDVGPGMLDLGAWSVNMGKMLDVFFGAVETPENEGMSREIGPF